MSSLHRIAQRVGRPLEAIRFESRYVDGQLIDVYRVVFLKFDHWFRVISSHGETSVERVAEPLLRDFDPEGGRMQYPINEVGPGDAAGPVLGRKLVAALEIVSSDASRGSFGFELEFEVDAGAQRLRLLSIDGETMDLSAGRSRLGAEFDRRPLLRVIPGGAGADTP